MPIIVSSGVSDQDINSISQRFSVVLPADYILFLREYNGLFIGEGSYCTLPFIKVDNLEIDFQELYGIDLNNPTLDLINANSISDEVILLDNPFVIGADPGGNPFIINGNGHDEAIYYWDRTHLHNATHCDYHEVNEEGNLYKAFDTFSEFYNIIMNTVGGDCELKEKQL